MATRRREATARDAQRQRLVQAALELFSSQGYAATTIDEIALRAGIGRRTFFRYFRSKEDVIFPDHTGLLERVEQRLYAWPQEPGIDAACAAVRLVLEHYVDNKQVSLQRYRLVGEVPSLRERETVSVAAYQRAFRNRIEPDHRDNAASLRAELMAAAVAAAHNQVLRQWLRGGGRGNPYSKLDDALQVVHDLFARMPSAGSQGEQHPSWFILAVPEEMPASQVAAELEKLRRTRNADAR